MSIFRYSCEIEKSSESLRKSELVFERTICETIDLFTENKNLMIAVAAKLGGGAIELALEKADLLQKHIDHIIEMLEKKCYNSGNSQ